MRVQSEGRKNKERSRLRWIPKMKCTNTGGTDRLAWTCHQSVCRSVGSILRKKLDILNILFLFYQYYHQKSVASLIMCDAELAPVHSVMNRTRDLRVRGNDSASTSQLLKGIIDQIEYVSESINLNMSKMVEKNSSILFMNSVCIRSL